MIERDYNAYRERHMAFWEWAPVDRPLIGFTVGAGHDAWSYWQDNAAAQRLLGLKRIAPDDIDPHDFVRGQLKYLEATENIADDVVRTAMPLASLPWMEAILGCQIISSGVSLKSSEILEDAAALQPQEFDPENPWVQKYLQFIAVYRQVLGDRFPVAQSVLRGPSDLAAALLGAEKAILALTLEGPAVRCLLEYVTGQLEKFLRLQLQHIPQFQTGYVIGQYDIWTPQPAIRIQEDFSVMYSPQLYDEFLKPLDGRLAGISSYTLLHLHAPSLFLIDNFLGISQVRAFQVSKDTGANLSAMMPALQKIQAAGKPLIVKGQFDEADLQLLKNGLSKNGLCIQPVVDSVDQAAEMLPLLKSWK